MKEDSKMRANAVMHEHSQVKLTLSDGRNLQLEDCWLRDHCRCSRCYHADTYQRALHILDIPDTAPISTTIDSAGITLLITWDDGHKSTYSLDLLMDYHPATWLAARCRQPILWRGKEVSSQVARVHVKHFLQSEEGAKRLFKSLLDYGVAFVEGVSVDVSSTEEVCKALGGVQRTLFGDMWKFTTEPEHADTAYTNIPLAPHTDNTYFTEAAGLQVLHCLEHSGGSGGETVLVDGFDGASLLHQQDPKHYDFLTQHISEAEYLESGHHHRHASTVIQLDKDTGLLQQISYPISELNIRSRRIITDTQLLSYELKRHWLLQQIRFNVYDRSPMPFATGEECRAYYTALRALARIYQDTAHQWWFKLIPGCVMIMDNFRVLHGRSAFTGRRVMCGSYVARSDWLDRARVLGLLV